MKRSVIFTGLLLLGAASLQASPALAAEHAAVDGTQAAAAADFGCLPQAIPALKPILPADSVLTEQPEVNCFAWQEFIALNWKADPNRRGQPDTSVGPDQFGNPAEGPVTWETFRETSELFLPNGETPMPWNAPRSIEGVCGKDHGLTLLQNGPIKILELTAKFHAGLSSRQILDELNEAGVTPPAFLTAQNGRLVHYEVLVNEDYFNYVVDPGNEFYDSRGQGAAVQPDGQGVNFPVGPSRYGPTGAMEFKAGWLEIEPDQRDRYLTTDAIIVNDGRCRMAMVGLVGLHIVHKTKSMPNWTWATFEHVQNAPNRVEVDTNTLNPPYTFYKPDCTPPDAPECTPNRKPQTGDPMDRPIQVVREVPIPDYVQTLNTAVHALIKKANAKSVFLNYRLINTQWPQSGEEIPVGAMTPLSQGGAAPTTGLSNTTAETYVQDKTCLTCHQQAAIACSSVSGPDPVYAADYSFQLSRASEPQRPIFCGSDDDD